MRRIQGQLVSAVRRALDLGKENSKLQKTGWTVTKVPDRALWRATKGDLTFVYSYNGRVFGRDSRTSLGRGIVGRTESGDGIAASEYAVQLQMENSGVEHDS